MTAVANTAARPTGPRSRLVRTPSYEEASARLHYLVEHGSRVGLLTGERGSGKSMLLSDFADELRRGGAIVAAINVAGIEATELLWSIAATMQAPVDDDDNLFSLWRTVNDRLLELRFLRAQAVVLIDDAGLASSDVLLHLYRLIHNEAAADARLLLILATTGEAVPQLGRHLLDLVDLRIDLPGWTLNETRVLAEGDGATSPRFTTAGLERLHRLSGGLPRQIVRLAELARLAAAAESLEAIDGVTVDGVYGELSVHAAAG